MREIEKVDSGGVHRTLQTLQERRDVPQGRASLLPRTCYTLSHFLQPRPLLLPVLSERLLEHRAHLFLERIDSPNRLEPIAVDRPESVSGAHFE